MTSLNDSNEIYPGDDEEVLRELNYRQNRRNKLRNLERDANETESESDDELGCESNYKIAIREPTIKEKEQLEENELLSALEQMNNERRKRSRILSLSSDDDSLHLSNNEDEENKPQIEIIQSKDKYEPTISTLENSIYQEENFSSIRTNIKFLTQNIINYDELLKIVVIGNRKVGKSLFIKRLMDRFDFKKNDEYHPTKTLEIKMTILKVNKREIKLELFDTNEQIINFGIIKTYYKLSNGFVFIVDTLKDINKLIFIKKQIEDILLSTNKDAKIFMIVNHIENDQQKEIPKENIKVLNDLKENYYIKIKHYNVKETNFTKDTDFIGYITDISNSQMKKIIRREKKSNFNSVSFKTSPLLIKSNA